MFLNVFCSENFIMSKICKKKYLIIYFLICAQISDPKMYVYFSI